MSNERQWFVQQNAETLLRERDEKIERQQRTITRLERSVASLKRQLQEDARSLKQRWQDDPRCHWCLMLTTLPRGNTPKGGSPDFVATLDHLISKKNGNGEKGNEVVLACYHCNFQRNNAEQKERPIELGRNGLKLTFLPSGAVLRESGKGEERR